MHKGQSEGSTKVTTKENERSKASKRKAILNQYEANP